MKYISTRGSTVPASAAEAILRGPSPDGGLYVPEAFPKPFTTEELAALKGMTYAERAAGVMLRFLDGFSGEELLDIAERAYSEEKFGASPARLIKAGGRFYLELFHGPTSAFKDMALQMLPHLLSRSLERCGQKEDALILVATSGDTGKAALEGFRDVPRTNVLVFYPKDGVSEIQKLQMTASEGENVNVTAVLGNFDDTQNGVKAIFASKSAQTELKKNGFKFSSANSINWGRVLPQIVYYISAYLDLACCEEELPKAINFCVPTGNFGNILAAYYAKNMGIPVKKLICASNNNNVLTEFINTGRYNSKRNFHLTLSPSMDILISSNLERLLFELAGRDPERVSGFMRGLRDTGEYEISKSMQKRLSELFYGGFCTDEDTKRTIGRIYGNDGYLLDPHTAVAVHVLSRYEQETGDDTPAVIISTASPYKFCESVLSAIGRPAESTGPALTKELFGATGVKVPKGIAALEGKPERFSDVTEKSGMQETVLRFARERARG